MIEVMFNVYLFVFSTHLRNISYADYQSIL